MTRHPTDRTNEESRQAYEAMNLRKRKVHRMPRNVAEAFVLREGTDCEDGDPTREQWRRAQRLTQRLL
jgi:hypothetical protein